MQTSSMGELVETIYAASLDPAAWQAAMSRVRLRYDSNMEAFYFLDFTRRTQRLIHLNGVDSTMLRDFGELYFRTDNPWARLTGRLHRPGMVRTDESLVSFTGDPNSLWRSVYYNEWMRPQRFRHTIGITPYAENGMVANVTLFRAPGMPCFSPSEVAEFEVLSRHFQRALHMGMRLEAASRSEALGFNALNALEDGLALVDAKVRLLYANPSLEALLREGREISVRDGALCCRNDDENRRFAAYVAATAALRTPNKGGAFQLVRKPGPALGIHAIPVRPTASLYLPERTNVLLIIGGVSRHPPAPPSARQMRHLYGFTTAEARLAECLVEGRSLQDAALRCGISYGTARGYLKLLFLKTDTHRQSALVARLLRGAAVDGR